MNIFKRSLTFSLIIVLIIGAGGCMFKKKDIPEEMVNYMRNKYNEEFTLISKDIQSWMSNSRTMIVEPAAFPGEQVQVSRDKSGVITDGYLALKINAEVEKEISAVVSEVYGENKVFNNAQTNAINDYKESDMSASDFLKLSPKITDATIFVARDSSDKDNDAEMFRQALESRGYYLTFYIVYIEKEVFPFVNRNNEAEYFRNFREEDLKEQNGVTAIGFFILDESFEFSAARWD